MSKLAIELYAGLHGWGEGLIAAGFRVVGFDIVDMGKMLGEKRPEGVSLVLQDVRTLHGSQFKNASLICASPPCQEMSYMAMPWSRAKQIEGALRGLEPFPEGYTGSRTIAELTALFDACFRIQREASEAAGRYIPLIVENVRGAQKWVGQAKANFGSYYLWGDVGMVGKRVVAGVPQFGVSLQPMRALKNNGGSWFAVANNTHSGLSQNPVSVPGGFKVPGISFNGEKGQTSPGFNVTAAQNYREAQKHNPDGTDHGSGSWFKIADSKNRGSNNGTAMHMSDELRLPEPRAADGDSTGEQPMPDSQLIPNVSGGLPGSLGSEAGRKLDGYSDPRRNGGKGAHLTSQRENDGRKQEGSGPIWFDTGIATHSSKSNSRKAASAQIARIPYPLARYVAQAFTSDGKHCQVDGWATPNGRLKP